MEQVRVRESPSRRIPGGGTILTVGATADGAGGGGGGVELSATKATSGHTPTVGTPVIITGPRRPQLPPASGSVKH